jgi:hypothetical protein
MRDFSQILKEGVAEVFSDAIEAAWKKYAKYQRGNSENYGWYTYNYMKKGMKPARKGVETRFLNQLLKAIAAEGLDVKEVISALSRRIIH